MQRQAPNAPLSGVERDDWQPCNPRKGVSTDREGSSPSRRSLEEATLSIRSVPFASVGQEITQYSKGKGGVQRRKTVAFSSFGRGSEKKGIKKPQVFQLWSGFRKKKKG